METNKRGAGISRRAALGLGLGGMTALLTACQTAKSAELPALPRADALSADQRELLSAARREGTVTLYSSNDPSVVDNIVAAMDHYDIKVDFQRLNSAPLAQRYSAEAQAGKVVADVIVTGDPMFADDAGANGWLAGIGSLPALAEWPARFKTDHYPILSVNPYCLGLNTELTDGTPREWTYAVDPKWEGQLVMANPATTGTVNLAAWNLLRERYGDDFLRQVGARKPNLFDSATSAMQQVAAGAGAVFMLSSVVSVQAMKKLGAPVAAVVPADAPTTGIESAACVSAKAPHPNAARFLLNFFMTGPGQKILNPVSSSPADAPGTPALPAKFVRPDYTKAKANKSRLLKLLDA
ncbi:ABC transporter substrate-binding protein [Streptomyces hyderabadensis]|uniref:ABC transporter substrate-binding protein n=1 Tax=Streptomyces hyderabadensis TaxID=598549 RepID=A0ABP9IQ42_9ACTN|nr:extracellular solute-binding protein [Streptomyces hyderabadensis]